MKNVLLIVLFTIFSCKSITETQLCEYKGKVFNVLLDKDESSFHQVNFVLGEMIYFLKIESCITSQNKYFELRGYVQNQIPKNGELTTNVPDIIILKSLKKNNQFIIKDTLTLSDKNGYFIIKTIRKKNEFLIIKQNSTKGICYDLLKFAPLSR
jgi:hypothetical protein